MLAADGLAEAFIGVGHRSAQPDIAVYSLRLAVDTLVRRDNMSREEAIEYIEFNVLPAWVGDETPIWITEMTMREYLDGLEEAGSIINEDYYSCKSARDKKEQEDGGPEASSDGKDVQE